MKVLCDACERLAVPTAWSVRDGVLELTCGACGAVSRQPPSPGAASVPAPAPAPVRGPPTQITSLSAQDLAVRAKATGAFAPEVPPGPPQGWLDERWRELALVWRDEAAHARLVDQAIVRNELEDLGKRYAEHLARHPGDTVAARSRDLLVQRAASRLFAQLPAEERGLTKEKANLVRNAAFVILLVGLAAFAAWIFVGTRVANVHDVARP